MNVLKEKVVKRTFLCSFSWLKDRFIFQLSDGVNVASHEACEIEVVTAATSQTPAAVTVLNRGLTVNRGSTTVLSVDMLNAVGLDGEISAGRMVYRVIDPPRLGYLGLSNETGQSLVMPVAEFSQSDLDARRVFYAQTIKATDGDDADSFQFRLYDVERRGSAIAEGKFQIRVKREVETAAVLPTLDVNVPVTVIEGYRTPITADNLHAGVSRPRTISDVVYSLVEPPRHGQLLRSGVAVADNFRFISRKCV